MLGTIDLREIHSASSETEVLLAYFQQLVGQPFLLCRVSYGDELSLHFGEPRPYRSPKLKHLVKGSYVLGLRASRWHLRSESPPIVVIGSLPDSVQPNGSIRTLTNRELEQANYIQRGALVMTANVIPNGSGYGLSLEFSDGASLIAVPERADPGETVADWELFTPYSRLLRVGPGLTWEYIDSQKPSASLE